MGRWVIFNTVLGLIVVLLGVEIAWTWTRSLPPVEITARPASRSPTAEKREKGKRAGDKGEKRGAELPTVLVSAIVERDLFDPSRQKPPPVEVEVKMVPKETGPPAGVSVVGVSIVGKEREAYVIDPSQQSQQRRLRVGDQIAGYTVKGIDRAAVTLVSPSGDPVTMALNVDKGKGGTPPAGKGAPTPPRPGQPANASPSAGIQGISPAAGVGAKPPPPVPPGVRPPVPAPAAPPAPVPQAAGPAAAPVANGPGGVVRERGGRLGRKH